MKKLTAILLTVMILSLTACGSGSGGNTEDLSPAPASESTNAPSEAEGDNGTASGDSMEDGNIQNEDGPEVSAENDAPQNVGNAETPSTADDPEQGAKILVAYFSRVGNTVW